MTDTGPLHATLVLLCAATAGLAHAEDSHCRVPFDPTGELHITLVGVAWDRWDETCARLARYLRPGGPSFPESTVVDAQRLLLDTGFFTTVRCEVIARDQILSCRVTPARMVRAVRFEGDVPGGILEDDLRRRVFLRPGTLVENERKELRRQQQRLEAFMRREGYFGSVVDLRFERARGAEPNEGIRLVIDVKPGRKLRLRQPTIRGELPPEWRIDEVEVLFRHYFILSFFEERFRPVRFETDIEKLIAEFQKLGFFEARVRGEWTPDFEGLEADIILDVDLGPRVLLEFIGNDAISDERLAKAATFIEAGAVDSVEIENTIVAVRRLYQERGYYSVKIEAHTEAPDPENLWVSFEVDEGPKAKIVALRCEGDNHYTCSEVIEGAELITQKSALLAPARYVDVVVEADVRTVVTWYKNQGYGAPKVRSRLEVLTEDTLAVVFEIEEGPRRTVEKMTMEGMPEDVPEEEIAEVLELREGVPYVHAKLGSDRREILSLFARRGYPQAKVKRDMVRPKPSVGGAVTIHYRIESGLRAVFGGVLVRGLFRTEPGLIEESLQLERGDPLDLGALANARRNLQTLGPFTSVELTPLDLWRGEEETWLLVSVRERAVRTLDLVLSLSTDDGLSVGFDFRDRNLFGRAMQFDVGVRAGAFFQEPGGLRIGSADSLHVTGRAPSPFGVPFDVEGSVFYRLREKTDFRESEIGVGAGLVRKLLGRRDCKWCPNVLASLRYEVFASEYLGRTGGALAFTGAATEPRSNVARVVPSLSVHRRDSFLDPRSGFGVDIRFELALDELIPLFDAATFWRVILNGQGFLDLGAPFEYPLEEGKILGGPIVFALGATYGASHPFAGSALPESESFRYGGDTSVRGMVLEGSATVFPSSGFIVEASAELRWYLLQNVGFGTVQLFVFGDLGSVAYDAASLFDIYTVSAGPGLRYVTPVGPISLAWGIPVHRPVEFDESVIPSLGRVHLTFGYTF